MEVIKNAVSVDIEDNTSIEIYKKLSTDSSYRNKEVQYSKWALSSPFATVTLYNTNKLVIYGKSAHALYKILFPVENETDMIAGLDETGKGDYFGPMITACVCSDARELDNLRLLGVKDSKSLKDDKIIYLAKKILENKNIISSVNVPNMQTYNNLFAEIQNQNSMLSLQHWDCLKRVFGKTNIDMVIIDKYASEENIEKYRPNELKELKVNIAIKAERNTAVAAASIVAKYYQIEAFKKLSQEYKIDLKRGCSKEVMLQAVDLVKRDGKNILGGVAKLHFKTTKEVLELV